MDIHEEGRNVIPLYQVIEGRTKESFSLKVAQAAGISDSVTRRAKQVSKNVLNNLYYIELKFIILEIVSIKFLLLKFRKLIIY